MNFPEFIGYGFPGHLATPPPSLFCLEVGFYYVVHNGLELMPQLPTG